MYCWCPRSVCHFSYPLPPKFCFQYSLIITEDCSSKAHSTSHYRFIVLLFDIQHFHHSVPVVRTPPSSQRSCSRPHSHSIRPLTRKKEWLWQVSFKLDHHLCLSLTFASDQEQNEILQRSCCERSHNKARRHQAPKRDRILRR